jgi:hypothetical protein
MATLDLSARKLPFTVAYTLTTKDIAYPVVFPDNAAHLEIEFAANAGKYAWTGTDGVILTGRMTCTANATYRIEKGAGNAPIYLQADGNGTVVHLSVTGM